MPRKERACITLQDIRRWIADDTLYIFYTSTAWQRLRAEVLTEDKHECQECKARGIYTAASHVHHVKHLREHPELALSKTYTDADGISRRNLVSVCKQCHETVCHPERLRGGEAKKQLNEERW